MGVRESLLNTITSVADSDFVRIVTAAGASSKATVRNLFKGFESNLSAKSSLTTSDYIRVVGSDNEAYKQSVASLLDIVSDREIDTPPSNDFNEVNKVAYHFEAHRWESSTLNSPYKSDSSTGDTGVVLSYFGFATYGVQLGIPSNRDYLYIRRFGGGNWFEWQMLPTRSEIDTLLTANTMQTWTPHLYDYTTKLRELPTQSYIKVGRIVVAWINANNINFSGINTMLQIKNLPMNVVLGGTAYFADFKDGTSGANRTVQIADSGFYLRPNIKSSDFNTPSGAGWTSMMIIGVVTQ